MSAGSALQRQSEENETTRVHRMYDGDNRFLKELDVVCGRYTVVRKRDLRDLLSSTFFKANIDSVTSGWRDVSILLCPGL